MVAGENDVTYDEAMERAKTNPGLGVREKRMQTKWKKRARNMVRSQKHNDCGVCAVANRCDITWAAARVRIFGTKRKHSFNTTTRMLTDAMFVNSWRLIRARDWYAVPNNSVVKVIPSGCRGTRNWHWVVWRDGMVWDSMHYVPLTPERYTHGPVSYIGYLK